ncbi:hypothetical protein ACGFIW_06320 [Micromonospora sp. NPDC048935]|uniref:hypothetical protein n=1 Tax=Micromonospora sp. NPDC048935 TaxID=3364262 RepID=UPI0037181ECC
MTDLGGAVDVPALVVEGRTNSAVAATPHLAERTVDKNVSSIFTSSAAPVR